MNDTPRLQGDGLSQQTSILLVSGAPGSGKTTLARPLAAVLRYPLISKDPLKESLYDSLGTALSVTQQTPADLSRLLSDAAMELLWTLAPSCPQVILEANFRPKNDYERGRIAALPGRKLEVYCYCTPQEAARRFAERATRTAHHPVHSMKIMPVDMLEEYDRPIGLCPVIPVNTEDPVSVPEIMHRIREHWPDLGVLSR